MKIYRTCLMILISAVASGWAQEPSSTLSWNDASGNVQSLRDYHGKIVVLNFWATWCVPCQHEMGLLADMQRKYQHRGVVLLGASLDNDKTQGQIAPVTKKHKIRFPILVGATTSDMQKLNLGEAIPATVFLDAEGKVVGRVLGELDKSDLQHRIEWMLGNHRGSEPPAFVDGLKKRQPQPGSPVFTH